MLFLLKKKIIIDFFVFMLIMINVLNECKILFCFEIDKCKVRVINFSIIDFVIYCENYK